MKCLYDLRKMPELEIREHFRVCPFEDVTALAHYLTAMPRGLFGGERVAVALAEDLASRLEAAP